MKNLSSTETPLGAPVALNNRKSAYRVRRPVLEDAVLQRVLHVVELILAPHLRRTIHQASHAQGRPAVEKGMGQKTDFKQEPLENAWTTSHMSKCKALSQHTETSQQKKSMEGGAALNPAPENSQCIDGGHAK